jgi:hypothetical protein
VKYLPLLLLLTGCTAGYTYTHVRPDGSSCSVTVDSSRVVQGAEIEILDDCSLSVTAQNLGADAELVRVMGVLVDKLP